MKKRRWKNDRRAIRGRRRRWLLFFIFCLGFAFAWQQQWVGRFLRAQVNRWLLPRTVLGERVTIQPLVLATYAGPPALVEGVQLTFSPAWSRSLMQSSPIPGVLLPPGFLVDGLMTSGAVRFSRPDDGAVYQVPFYIQVQDTVGFVPELKVRFPADKLNFVLDDVFAEDWTERGEYLLGSYDLEQRIRFDVIRIWTYETDAKRPLHPLIFRATATGRLRYRFRDGWFRARVTARVRELTISFVLIPIAYPDGIGFDYRARIDTLDLGVSWMPRWGERRLTRAVHRSLERSLNRRRKRERLARQRLPLWLPMALSVDIEIVNPEDPEDAL